MEHDQGNNTYTIKRIEMEENQCKEEILKKTYSLNEAIRFEIDLIEKHLIKLKINSNDDQSKYLKTLHEKIIIDHIHDLTAILKNIDDIISNKSDLENFFKDKKIPKIKTTELYLLKNGKINVFE